MLAPDLLLPRAPARGADAPGEDAGEGDCLPAEIATNRRNWRDLDLIDQVTGGVG